MGFVINCMNKGLEVIFTIDILNDKPARFIYIFGVTSR
jgi:hypothetical protein